MMTQCRAVRKSKVWGAEFHQLPQGGNKTGAATQDTTLIAVTTATVLSSNPEAQELRLLASIVPPDLCRMGKSQAHTHYYAP
jgi:hypothetical protein